MALVTTQPPIQWVNLGLTSGVRGPKREADYSSPSYDEAKSGAVNLCLMYRHGLQKDKFVCVLTLPILTLRTNLKRH